MSAGFCSTDPWGLYCTPCWTSCCCIDSVGSTLRSRACSAIILIYNHLWNKWSYILRHFSKRMLFVTLIFYIYSSLLSQMKRQFPLLWMKKEIRCVDFQLIWIVETKVVRLFLLCYWVENTNNSSNALKCMMSGNMATILTVKVLLRHQHWKSGWLWFRRKSNWIPINKWFDAHLLFPLSK